MIPVFGTPDPIRVIVEQGGSSTWADWGPLVGVVVGAVLGAVGQIVAGRLQRSHDAERENIAVRRALYGQILRALDGLLREAGEAALAAEGKVDPGGAINRFVDAANALVRLLAETGVSGSLEVYEEIRSLLDGLAPTGLKPGDAEAWRQQHRRINQSRALLMALMRLDLKTPGDVPTANSRRNVEAGRGADQQ
ncbi:hypothetical protein [Actinotalea fermentans]|uniref:Uncharacterized protein n=1 Tax=Actinotalea fermentans TaxID=43671 RepID=A0A511YX47_9CELL|nr:hypothetical protein [Actinotalea fermentans]KGM16145.1 hypothetical protein N867_02720 [Actinotalea fermentans ATCC 43279 = JCM 9966 = DSM 3133]GEN79784.1 hypothetical protein AFE02nite_15180 [Actinotalea fermentans]